MAALGLAASVTLAATNEVVSVNVVGYAKVNVPASKLVLCSAGFNTMDPNATVQEIMAGQLTGGWDYFGGDHVYLWDATAQQYTVLWKQDTGGVLDGDGWLDSNTGVLSTNKLVPGSAFWVESSQTADQTLTLLGEVVSAPTVNVPMVEGLNFFSYPYSADQALTNSTLQAANGSVGGWDYFTADHVYSWDVTSQQYTVYWLQDTAGVLDGDGWVDANTGVASTEVMSLAEGFWYERMAGSGSLTWSPTIPYTL